MVGEPTMPDTEELQVQESGAEDERSWSEKADDARGDFLDAVQDEIYVDRDIRDEMQQKMEEVAVEAIDEEFAANKYDDLSVEELEELRGQTYDGMAQTNESLSNLLGEKMRKPRAKMTDEEWAANMDLMVTTFRDRAFNEERERRLDKLIGEKKKNEGFGSRASQEAKEIDDVRSSIDQL